jgi:hypothetical protein
MQKGFNSKKGSVKPEGNDTLSLMSENERTQIVVSL